MGRIQILPLELVTKIAAGEVIERPASVVKELLENAVDAGARRIDVDVEAGGTELIRVVDDGCGIEPEDLPLAFAPHATSKLRSEADLFAIHTMGFRGEALASIGSVAQVLLQSRTWQADCGAEIRCQGGVLSDIRPWNGSAGTRVEVRHLFYNVPVRKKFLKSIATELNHICEAVTRLALAQPQLHLTLRHNGKLVYEVPATAGLRERIALFFGVEVSDALYEVDSGPGIMRLSGYIADPSCDRGHSRMQYFFLNGRWFRDRTIASALQEAYRGLLVSGRYPVAFLYLTLPPEQVDINVHPTKAEVRFQESSLIYTLVRSAIQRRLQHAQLVPQWQWNSSPASVPSTSPPHPDPSLPTSRANHNVGAEPQFGVKPQAASNPIVGSSLVQTIGSNPALMRTTHPHEPQVAASPLIDLLSAAAPTAVDLPGAFPPGSGSLPEISLPLPQPAETPKRREAAAAPRSSPQPPSHWSGITPVGESVAISQAIAAHADTLPALQVQDTYIVLETPGGILVIDQHALHERILFEQLRQRVLQGTLEVQPLLVPEPLELTPNELAQLLGVIEELHFLGLELMQFGSTTILIHSYPTLLGRRSPQEIVRGIIDQLLNEGRPPDRETLLYHLMATMACKAAIKAGDRLSNEEIAALLKYRELADNSHHCPHGRPTAVLISRADLDRQFRRS